jgi:hypothetical protein
MTKEQLAQQSESSVAKNRSTGMSQAEKDKETAIGNLQKKADALNGTSNTPDTGNEGELTPVKKTRKKRVAKPKTREDFEAKQANKLKDQMHNKKKDAMKAAIKAGR